MAIPVEFFSLVQGSMTSDDGHVFMLRVKREDDGELMLGFPHREISNIVECAAMQMDKGRDKDGEMIVTALKASSFQLGMGPKGETVLSLIVGDAGRISFALPPDMERQLFEMLQTVQAQR